MKKTRIFVADDHGLIREGLRAVISANREWELCGEAADGRTAVELAAKLKPDICVLDVTMPELNGIEATRQIVARHPATAVLILTMHDSESLAQEILAAGARGYLLKNDAPELLPRAIESLALGRAFFTPRVADLVLRNFGDKSAAPAQPQSRLTPRERELVQLLAEGKSNKEAAAALGISVATVETHRKNVMSKLQLHSPADLVRYAIRNNLAQA
jgi:DNA-binding NarL/FixJ family response regulator